MRKLWNFYKDNYILINLFLFLVVIFTYASLQPAPVIDATGLPPELRPN